MEARFAGRAAGTIASVRLEAGTIVGATEAPAACEAAEAVGTAAGAGAADGAALGGCVRRRSGVYWLKTLHCAPEMRLLT